MRFYDYVENPDGTLTLGGWYNSLKKPEPSDLNVDGYYGTVLKRVPNADPTARPFFISENGKTGCAMWPDGKLSWQPAGTTAGKSAGKYETFKNAFGFHKEILAAHAVWKAWVGRKIPYGMEIDHINGNTHNNRPENLRLVKPATNQRDGGFLRMLRNRGIDPTWFSRPFLLRFFRRMTRNKKTLSQRKYYALTHDELLTLIVSPEYVVTPQNKHCYDY